MKRYGKKSFNPKIPEKKEKFKEIKKQNEGIKEKKKLPKKKLNQLFDIRKKKK